MARMVFLEKHCKELESVQGVVSVTLDSTIQRVQSREAILYKCDHIYH
jgi:hypothetical protein